MKPSLGNGWPTVIAGFGSPHGDDQAGWRLAAMMQGRPSLPAQVIAIYEATQLLEALTGCERLVIVDACQSGGAAGSVTRLRWPDPRIVDRHGHSTHGVSICHALKLAERLERLPPVVDVFGIEVENCLPGSDVSPTVLHAVLELAAQIRGELSEVAHA